MLPGNSGSRCGIRAGKEGLIFFLADLQSRDPGSPGRGLINPVVCYFLFFPFVILANRDKKTV
jgi:hypothetical protein